MPVEEGFTSEQRSVTKRQWPQIALWLMATIGGLSLVLVISPLLKLDHTMRLHLWNLFARARVSFLVGQGTTAIGFVSPYSVGALSSIITVLLMLWLRGRQAVFEHVVKNVSTALCAALIGNLAWYGSLFAWSVAKTIYEDHITSVTSNSELRKENTRLTQEGDSRQKAAATRSLPQIARN